MSIYDPNRRALAHRLAQTAVLIDVQPFNNQYRQGEFAGLEFAARAQGFTEQQLSGIICAARDWATVTCPGMTAAPSPHCIPGCTKQCHEIPLDPRRWRAL